MYQKSIIMLLKIQLLKKKIWSSSKAEKEINEKKTKRKKAKEKKRQR